MFIYLLNKYKQKKNSVTEFIEHPVTKKQKYISLSLGLPKKNMTFFVERAVAWGGYRVLFCF